MQPIATALNDLSDTAQRYKHFRKPAFQSVAAIEGLLLKGARKYFDEAGFKEVVVPHITKATGACENIDTLFGLDFFGKTGYLCQTGQLYLESLVPTLGKVYCIGPSFRAEPKVDGRHLTEFTLAEIEFPGDMEELLKHIEETIFSMISSATIEGYNEFKSLGIDISHMEQLTLPFKRMTYTEAVNTLEGVEWGDDLKSSHEAYLSEKVGSVPLFITHYPKAIKFFNMRENGDDRTVVNSVDLILPYSGEAVGAAEREFEHTSLRRRLKESPMLSQLERRGGSIEDFSWYLEGMEMHGSLPHAGCGIGVNRVTQYALRSGDIRASTPFPQNMESLM